MTETKSKGYPSSENISALLGEARMVLPGIQTLFGFQLISILTEGFQKLTSAQRSLHFLALIASAISVTLVMAPAAYHRIAEQWRASSFFLRASSYLIAVAMAVLLVSLTLEIWVVATTVFTTRVVAWAAAIGIFCLGTSLWFIYPFFMSRGR
jgi:hypothetical protein